jgi:hypothetical protein
MTLIAGTSGRMLSASMRASSSSKLIARLDPLASLQHLFDVTVMDVLSDSSVFVHIRTDSDASWSLSMP